tara:strand:+ start:2215 stop:2685 length:471 start_codon:yes stop_codon:yes gene_type:complete
VFGEVGQVGEVFPHRRVLFKDLTRRELVKRFIKPYEKGGDFLSDNHDIIPLSFLRTIEIIRTEYPSKIEQDELRRKEREEIERLHGPDSGYVYDSAGDPTYRDLNKVGENVNHIFLKGQPGYKARRWEPSLKAIAWVSGVVATVIAAGIVKWLGWL